MVVLAGNHDTYFRHSNEVNAPRLLLKEYRGIRVVDEPEVLRVGGIEAVVLPWICKDNEKDVKDLLDRVNTKVLFGHLELTGFCMYKGIPNAHGADPKIFDKFDMVFTGHFHHRSNSGNIHYLGTPYELTWMDYNDPRGFHIFDTKTMDLTFVENPYKMFHKIAFDDEGKDLDTLLSIDTSGFKDAYVQVVVVKKTNPYYLDMFVKHLEQSGAADVKVSENALSLELNDDQVIDVEDTLSILKDAVDSIDTSVPKDNLSQFMVKLYTEAKQIEV
jgi:DNA repair exonuclease SbcCD nuclease subunit